MKRSRQVSVRSIPAIIFAVAVLLVHASSISAQDHDLIDTAYPRLAILQKDTSAAFVARTWDGGGTTNNWSEAANWSDDTVPTPSDNPIFDSTSSKNAIIDVSVSLGPITITAGYTGSITMAPGVNASFAQMSSISGGTLSAGSGTLFFGGNGFGLNLSGGTVNAGSGPIVLDSTLNQTGGTFNGSSGNVSGCFNISGGTFVAPSGNLTTGCEGGRFKPTTFAHNNGTFVFTGGNANIEANPVLELHNLTLNKNESGDLNILEAGRTIRVAGTLSLLEGRLAGAQFHAEGPVSIAPNYGSANSSVGGSGTIVFKDIAGARNITWPSTASLPHIRIEDDGVTLTLSGPGPARSGGITMLTGAIQGGSADMEIGHGASTGHALDQSGGTFSLGDGDLLLPTGAFRITGGTFTMGSGNMTFPCSLSVTIGGGIFNASSGTTTMCSTGDFNGNFTQTAGVFNGGSGTLDINHNFTLSGGTFNASSATTLFGFVFTHSAGTFNHNNGTVVFDSIHGGYSINNPGTENFHNLTLNPAGSLSLTGDNWIANGTLRLMNGVIDGGILQSKGDMIVENISDGGTSQIMFNGTGNQIYTNNGGPNTTGAWTVNKAGGMLTVATDMILGNSQALNITLGRLVLGNGSDLTVGPLTIGASGTLNADSVSTITLGSNPINNGRLELNGGGANCPDPDTILLRSTVEGTRRNWSGTGIFELTDVDVKDMGGTSDTTPAIKVFNGTNSLNNRANWTFDAACGAANRVAFVVQPTNTTAGQIISPAVQVAIVDQFGNTIPTATNPVTLAISSNPSGEGALTGTVTRNAVNGIATFDDLSIARGGNGYTLRATSSGLLQDFSSSFNIIIGPAVKLAFITQPGNTAPLAAIAPAIQVALQDAAGNTVPTSVTQSIFVQILANPADGRIGGDIDNVEINGVATFPNITIDQVGDGYTLIASADATITPAVSEPFNIVRTPFMVTSTNNSGPGSLRQAILNADHVRGADTIHFNVQGGGPVKLIPATVLPTPAEGVTIDATSQPGFAGTPIVELSGEAITGEPLINAGFILNGDSTVRGFVINRFALSAIYLRGLSNSVFGNYIGIDATGNNRLVGRYGVYVDAGLDTGANRIGGPTAADRNVIAAADTAVFLAAYSGHRTQQNFIVGNYIGTNAAGTAAVGGAKGIDIRSNGNEVGNNGAGSGNLISGNDVAIDISGSNNFVWSNTIGPNATRTQPLAGPARGGINITGTHNQIGDPVVGGNTIAFNRYGVRVTDSPAQNSAENRIRGNSIHSNIGLGIDLAFGGDGVTPNDPGDQDGGPNALQNYPSINSVVSDGVVTEIRGFTNGPNLPLTLDFYVNTSCHPLGSGEGSVYLGSVLVLPEVGGIASFGASFPAVPLGRFITATATDAGNTSEFTPCAVVGPSIVSISGRLLTPSGNPIGSSSVKLTGSKTASTVTDRFGNYTFANLPGARAYTVTPQNSLYNFAPQSRTYNPITSNQTAQDFVGTRSRFNITGSITSGSIGASDVMMVVSGDRAETYLHLDQFYALPSFPPGNYTLTPVKEGYTFNPPVANVAITDTDRRVDFTFNASSPPLPGRILVDFAGSLASINADGTSIGPLNPTLRADYMSVTRDGKRITYTRRATNETGGKSLFVSDADGANEVRIILGTSTLDNFHPEWSPDGTRIAFVQISSGRKALRIRNANGTIVSVPMTPGLIDFRHPTWLSNTRLALSARNSSSVFSIYAVNTDGSNLVRLAQGTGLLGFEMPVASPDGSKIIVYRSTSFNAGELLMMNGDGTGLTTIRTDARPMRATWSPDGSRYAFVQVGATPMTDYALISVLASSGAGPRTIKTGFFGTPSWGPRYEFATTGGTNVLTAAGGASVRFTSVNPGGGTTTFTPVSAYIGLPPEGYATGSRGYEIFTTAAYSSPVTVCIKAPQSAVPTLAAFNASTLMHREGTLAVDRTTSRNFATREICGETPTLGQFALGQLTGTPSPITGGALPSITGMVTDQNGTPMTGVTIELTGSELRETQTDVFGIFEFPNLTGGGNYNVRPVHSGYIFGEESHTFIDLTGENTVAFVGSQAIFSISGKIRNVDGSPAVGVNVNLDAASLLTTQTDTNGDYLFEDLGSGQSYTVTPSGTGFFSPLLSTVAQLSGHATGVDFVHYANAPEFVTVTGRVMDADGFAIPMARVTMIGPGGEAMSALSNPFGYFIFTEARPGDVYSIGVKKKGSEFSTSPYSIYVTSAMSNVDFVADP